MTEFTEYEIQLRYDGTYNGIELRLHTWGISSEIGPVFAEDEFIYVPNRKSTTWGISSN